MEIKIEKETIISQGDQNIILEKGDVINIIESASWNTMGLSKEAEDFLKDWVNTGGRNFSIPEIDRLALEFKNANVTMGGADDLYRGLLLTLQKDDPKTIQFLKETGLSLEEAKNIGSEPIRVDYTTTEISSWSKSEEIASEFGNIVVESLFGDDETLVSLGRFTDYISGFDESEVLVLPGKYRVSIYESEEY